MGSLEELQSSTGQVQFTFDKTHPCGEPVEEPVGSDGTIYLFYIYNYCRTLNELKLLCKEERTEIPNSRCAMQTNINQIVCSCNCSKMWFFKELTQWGQYK
ncbi:hypothetical protein XENORESO_017354 [Xenotaenia resolanae]|uniref:Uncharacterized protein n=1 Tax=Xenotaenia resolanae TaxID=208358 RepID=A0ABV0WKR4_9TELE